MSRLKFDFDFAFSRILALEFDFDLANVLGNKKMIFYLGVWGYYEYKP